MISSLKHERGHSGYRLLPRSGIEFTVVHIYHHLERRNIVSVDVVDTGYADFLTAWSAI